METVDHGVESVQGILGLSSPTPFYLAGAVLVGTATLWLLRKLLRNLRLPSRSPRPARDIACSFVFLKVRCPENTPAKLKRSKTSL